MTSMALGNGGSDSSLVGREPSNTSVTGVPTASWYCVTRLTSSSRATAEWRGLSGASSVHRWRRLYASTRILTNAMPLVEPVSGQNRNPEGRAVWHREVLDPEVEPEPSPLIPCDPAGR